MGLRPKPRGGFATRMLLGAPPRTPLGLGPKPGSEGGLAAGALSGGLGTEPPAAFLRRSRRGVWAETQPPPRRPLAHAHLLAMALAGGR